MDGLVLTDSGKNLYRRAVEEVRAGRLAGVLLSAPLTPPTQRNGKGKRDREPVQRFVDGVGDEGGEVMLDAMTHIVTDPHVTPSAIYHQWDLWAPGRFGDLSTGRGRVDHVARVIGAQQSFGLQTLAPALSLQSPGGTDARHSRALGDLAIQIDPAAWITVAGTPDFWGAGLPLDGYIASLRDLGPAGFVLAVVRGTAQYPGADATAPETAGLARTTLALASDGPVLISHGDLAALPAVAAGASGIGTGFDVRQRVLSPASFRPASGGRYSFRTTFSGILAAMGNADARRVFAAEPAAQQWAGGGMPRGERIAYQRHFEALASLVADVRSGGQARGRAHRLRDLYVAADAEWASMRSRLTVGRGGWIAPFAQGHRDYITGQGW